MFHPTALGHPSLGAACPCQAGVPALPDSIGANTVGALWLGGIWLPGSNSPPGEDDDNMLGGEAGLGGKKKKMTMSVCELLWDCFKVLPKKSVGSLHARALEQITWSANSCSC